MLAVAIVARATWELLRPVVPALFIGLVLVGVVRLVAGRYRQW